MTITRRQFVAEAAKLGLGGSLALSALSGLASGRLQALQGPSSGPRPRELTFVGWVFQNIYDDIFPSFEKYSGIRVNPVLLPTPEPQMQRLTTMFASGETIDTLKTNESYLGSLIANGVIQPLDGLPGLEDYVADFTPLSQAALERDGHIWGLPYYAAIRLPVYYEDNLRKAGFDHPFRTWDELVEQSLKAKRDGVAEYPVLWVAGLGWEFASGTWYTLVANRGGRLFDQDHTPELGPGSVARETLKWWRKTFVELEISDPSSLEMRLTPAARAFNAGRHLYQIATQQYFAPFMNDPSQSPIAGRVKFMMMPGEGITTGLTAMYCMGSTTSSVEWSWKLLEFLGGKTPDGEYTQALRIARDTMLGSGYRSVMAQPIISEWWSKYSNVDVVLQQWTKAIGWQEILPTIWEPWFTRWNDIVAVEVQRCLRGEITADAACDRMEAGIREAKRFA